MRFKLFQSNNIIEKKIQNSLYEAVKTLELGDIQGNEDILLDDDILLHVSSTGSLLLPCTLAPVLLQTVFCGANLSAGLIPSLLGSDKFVEVRARPGI